MLRPERMSRVSVTGAKRVLDDVIETVHDLHLVHVTDYDGAWEGFEPGDPIAGADEAAERLVTVRSLQSILDIDPDDVDTEARTEVDVGERLERVRQEVNELDDRRDELEDERRAVEERADSMAPLETLGIDLDLLWGYDSLETRVGEGNEEAIREALDTTDEVESYEIFSEDDAIAVFARPASGANDVLEDTLVGAEFTAIDVPEAEGTPEEYLTDLEKRRMELEEDISAVESELADLRAEHEEFLLTAEEQLAIEVEKREAPLSFATTQNAFVAEGWIPTDQFDDLAAALDEHIGPHCEVEELERASYDGDGRVIERDPTEPGETGSSEPEAIADGGTAQRNDMPMADSEPPVVQENPGPVGPFEILTKAVGRPTYSEIDPTIILFLTFPAFFGFMIGDVAYGFIYMAAGYYLYTNFDSEGFTSMGLVTIAAGFFTALFGFFFGEIFGLHLVTNYIWEPLIGGAPIHKGLYPANLEWARAWFIISALVGVLHLDIAYSFEFIEDLQLHGVKDAILDSSSWLFALNGLWIFIFSRLFAGPKPDFIFEVFNQDPNAAFALGFNGFPVWVGWLGLALIGVGFVLLAVGPTYELIEFHTILAHPLSYLRIAAELLAEVGLIFAVNLLFFGVYATGHGSEVEWHFALWGMPEVGTMHHGHMVTEILFPGLVHMGIIAVIGGILILIVGNLIVLALGVLSVGIQAIRLEYFEFFSKFYDGGGIPYSPFGRVRRFTGNE